MTRRERKYHLIQKQWFLISKGRRWLSARLWAELLLHKNKNRKHHKSIP